MAFAASSCVESDIPPICDGSPGAFPGITSCVAELVVCVAVPFTVVEAVDEVVGVGELVVGLEGVKLPEGVKVKYCPVTA